MIRIARHQQNACSIFRSGFDGIPYARALTVDWAKEIYKLMDEYKIKGTPDLYTIAINSCSQTCDWEFALSVYNDMKKKGVVPDEIFLRALIDVAGHAGRVDAAFDILEEARTCGMHLGIVSYSCLMGACSNVKGISFQKQWRYSMI
ncbi:pentatricopeptide repeat-containing protein MRL1, chloroplastic-like [Eucalyptus grandis]|uniref:pentatricopeptide repeat-containing protein MRL1, chloroplastic-like n=1 Tax=Eucalyptus grandis TaxID=71139 RepID=UPI00192ED4D5|nr:pentatricopeptide repeat-containing protein MRL1, chloroplastic-like [Eucalyptus grandis]XP_039160789.1 pentatricopeptide repeat-containing protein MRL1, chloroplastic-like [Eucalyptus grandis]